MTTTHGSSRSFAVLASLLTSALSATPLGGAPNQIIVRCLLSNMNDPTLMCLADIIVDSGCSFLLVLPKRKLEQLRVTPVAGIPPTPCTTFGNTQEELVYYNAIKITVPLGKSVMSYSIEDTLALPDDQKRIGPSLCQAIHQKAPAAPPEATATAAHAPATPPFPPTTATKEISPLKNSIDRVTSEHALCPSPGPPLRSGRVLGLKVI